MPDISQFTNPEFFEVTEVTDSTAFVANSLININEIQRSFFITYPDPAPAGLAIQLLRRSGGGGSKDLVAAPDNVTDNTSIPNRDVVVSRSTDGTDITLQCGISQPSSGGVPDEHYEVRVSADGPVARWIYTADDLSDVIQVACDPVAEFQGLPRDLLEKQTDLQLTARPASRAGATTLVRDDGRADDAGLPNPAATYLFGHQGLLAILGMQTAPSTSQSYTLTEPLPGVYGPTAVPFTVDVVYPGIGGTSFLRARGVGPTTITTRPQRVQLILDRSTSMNNEHRWDNAKTAARIFINFFGEFRAGVNSEDRIGVTVFEDPVAGFRSANPAGPPFITDVIPLGHPEAVAGGDLGPGVFGTPTGGTPIGDGLFFGLRKLQEAGLPPDVRFTVVLMTDGEENRGTIKIGPGAVTGNPRTWGQAVLDPAIREITKPQTDFNLFAIGVSSAANFPVLNTLVPARNLGAALDVGKLISFFGTMFGVSQEANLLETRVTRVSTDPVPPAPQTEIFFDTTAAQRFGVAVLKEFDPAQATDDVEIAIWNGTDFLVQDIKPDEFEGHFYLGVPNALSFGDDGTATWRIRRLNGTTAVPITLEDVFAFEDLHVKSLLTLDKKDYLTGDAMRLSVEIRDDSEPVLGATVSAALDAPGDGFGSLLATLGQDDLDVLTEGGDSNDDDSDDDKDRPTGRAALIGAILRKYGWDDLPRSNPDHGGLFADGTNLLHDKNGDGIYTNTFRKVNAEGVYNWTLSASGKDAHERPFSHKLDQSVLAAIGVSKRETIVDREKLTTTPPAQAVKVTITPRDTFENLLGPGFDRRVFWAVENGQFEHVVNKQPAPVNTDGTYTRTVLFRRGQHPTLRVSVNGVILRRIDLT
jgi:hypothetical protein